MAKKKTKKASKRRSPASRSPTLKALQQPTIMEEDTEYLLDEVTGRKRKSSPLHILNKKKVSKYELDELFAGDEW